jgi:hypothetical protein
MIGQAQSPGRISLSCGHTPEGVPHAPSLMSVAGDPTRVRAPASKSVKIKGLGPGGKVQAFLATGRSQPRRTPRPLIPLYQKRRHAGCRNLRGSRNSPATPLKWARQSRDRARAGGSGSRRLANRQAQARQVELSVLGVPPVHPSRHDQRRDRTRASWSRPRSA